MNKDVNKKRFFIVAVLFFALLIPQISIADDLVSGIQAPFFSLKSGFGDKFTRDNIIGKVIILFYETKGAKEKNRKTKNELNIFYNQQEEWVKELVMRLAIINCSSAVWPITGIWRSKLRANSKKEGITVYGDWDGSMRSDYNMKDDDSNVMLIDKKGMIRYSKSGMLDDSDISKIKELLKELVNEK
ncbi:MAG: YtfJ family protein [Candidatus Anammoxibacter sp.]